MARYSWLITALLSVSIGIISFLSVFDINVLQAISEFFLKHKGDNIWDQQDQIVAFLVAIGSFISVFVSFITAIREKKIDGRKSDD